MTLKKTSASDFQGILPGYRDYQKERESAIESHVNALMREWNSKLSGEALYVALVTILCGLPINPTDADRVKRKARLSDGSWVKITYVRMKDEFKLPFRQDRSMVYFLENKGVTSASPFLDWKHVNEYQHLFGLHVESGRNNLLVQERFCRVASMSILLEVVSGVGKVIVPQIKVPIIEAAAIAAEADGEGNWRLTATPAEMLAQQKLIIGRTFREVCLKKIVPLPIELVRATYKWPRIQDYASFLYWRTFAARNESFIAFEDLYHQFDNNDSNERRWRSEFKKAVLTLRLLPEPFPRIKVDVGKKGITVYPLPEGTMFFDRHPKHLFPQQ